MKKLTALLCAVCAAAMSLCVACASPLTGEHQQHGPVDHPVVVAVTAVVDAAHRGKRRKNKQRADRPGQWPGAVFMLLALAIDLNLAACGE